MSTTPQDSQQDQEDFAAAFADEQTRAPELSEDEAFGLTLEEEPAMAEGEEMAPEAAASDAETSGGGMSGDISSNQEPSVTVAIAPDAEEDGSVSSDEPMSDKDLQRAKSWEGRLKAREAELKAREDAMNQHMGKMESGETSEESVEPALVEALEDATEAVESGQMTADEAMANLTNDFGEDFTRMLSVLIEAKASEIAGKTAGDRVDAVSQRMDGLADEMTNDKARSHFESISDAHPDFMEIADSPSFKDYIDGMEGADKLGAMQTIETGSARSLNKLLDTYKASLQAEEPVDEPVNEPVNEPVDEVAMDAAEGVRSKGLKLPEKPAMSEDYEGAWEKF